MSAILETSSASPAESALIFQSELPEDTKIQSLMEKTPFGFAIESRLYSYDDLNSSKMQIQAPQMKWKQKACEMMIQMGIEKPICLLQGNDMLAHRQTLFQRTIVIDFNKYSEDTANYLLYTAIKCIATKETSCTEKNGLLQLLHGFLFLQFSLPGITGTYFLIQGISGSINYLFGLQHFSCIATMVLLDRYMSSDRSTKKAWIAACSSALLLPFAPLLLEIVAYVSSPLVPIFLKTELFNSILELFEKIEAFHTTDYVVRFYCFSSVLLCAVILTGQYIKFSLSYLQKLIFDTSKTLTQENIIEIHQQAVQFLGEDVVKNAVAEIQTDSNFRPIQTRDPFFSII